MPSDEILDDLEWEDMPKEEHEVFEEEAGEDYDELEGFDPDVEILCIRRFTFNLNAQLAALILRNHKIPYFVNNSLTNNMLQLQSFQVELFVRKEDAERAWHLLEDVGEE